MVSWPDANHSNSCKVNQQTPGLRPAITRTTIPVCSTREATCQRIIFLFLVLFCVYVYTAKFLYESPIGGDEELLNRCPCEPTADDAALKNAKEELSSVDPYRNLSSWESLDKHHPNFPLHLLKSPQPRCHLMPDVFKIQWSGVHWQSMQGPGGETFLLYSAFYDNRTYTEPAGGTVRVLVLVNQSLSYYFPHLPWCYLWYKNQIKPVPSKVVRADYVDWQWRRTADRLLTFVLTCPAPDRPSHQAVPQAVSLVAKPCDKATNILKVIGKANSELPSGLRQRPTDYDNATSPSWRVGICGPALYYYQQDFSLRLVEWLELVRAMGVSRVHLYTTRGVHPNMDKVLRHYEDQDFVQLTDFHYPPPYMDEPVLRRLWTRTERSQIFSMENIYFSDCLLRNKDSYRFLTHFDPDELPVLLKHDSLPQLVANLAKITADWPEPPPAYKLYWQFFHTDVMNDDIPEITSTTSPLQHSISSKSNMSRRHDAAGGGATTPALPSYLHILRHTRRLLHDDAPKHKNHKSIYDTFDSTAAMSHKVIVCAGAGVCSQSQELARDVAYMAHFMEQCGKACHDSAATEHVPQVLQHARAVVPKVEAVVRELGLLP